MATIVNLLQPARNGATGVAWSFSYSDHFLQHNLLSFSV